jgi:hypothetical protein
MIFVFESIKLLRPHFHSLREIQENVSLDIKLPLTWRYEDVVKPYSSIKIKVQDKNEKFNLISIISQATQNGYDVIFACANEIVTINKEEEEKQRLFQQKVRELQELFKKESLDKLKDINLLDTYGQEDTTSVGLVDEGDGEGQSSDGDSEETDD